MTNPKPGDLGLFVSAENVPVECNYFLRKGAFAYNCKDGELFSELKDKSLGTCPHCYGSGTRKVTLEGWVEVTECFEFQGEITIEVSKDLYVREIYIEDARLFLHDKITEALRNGTCPEPIRAQLKVVEDEDRD